MIEMCCVFLLTECCGSLAYVKHNNMMQYWEWSLQEHVGEIEIYFHSTRISPDMVSPWLLVFALLRIESIKATSMEN